MSEQEIREGMLVAVWDEPPLDFDPDAVIARAQKFRTRRRALVSVGVATALVVVTAFMVPTLLTRQRPDATVASQPSATSATPSESTRDRERRLGTRIVELVVKTKPMQDVVTLYDDNGHTFPKMPGDVTGGLVMFTDDIGPTAISFRIGKPVDVKQQCVSAKSCVEQHQKDGSSVLLIEYSEGAEVVQAVATHQRLDGTAVSFTAYSHNPATGSGYRKTVPLGPAALSMLATDPQVRWD